MDTQDTREIIKDKLRQNFAGKIVRKDLTKRLKRELMFRFTCWNFCWDNIAALMILSLSKRR